MEDKDKKLIEAIVAGIEEKKGEGIRVLDLSEIGDTITRYTVICEGNTPIQVRAIEDSVWDTVYKLTGEKPAAIDGLRNCLWVAMDYVDTAVHIFIPETRQFYDIDNLWDDAKEYAVPATD